MANRSLIRRGVTALEVVIALVVVAIAGTAAITAGQGMSSDAEKQATRASALVYVTEATRIAAITQPFNEFPTSTTDTTVGGITARLNNSLGNTATFTAATSTDTTVISVGFDENTPGELILAVYTPDADTGADACIVAGVSPTSTPTWGYDPAATTCNGTTAMTCTLTGGTRDEPVLIDVDACS